MDPWLYIVIVGCIGILSWAVRLLFYSEAEREHDEAVAGCLDRQALKRGGTVSGKVLTVPHQNVVIQASYIPGSEENPSESHTYATFRAEAFSDQKFGIYYWKELMLRPALLAGSRLELFEEEFGGTYIVSGNDIAFVERVLTPEIRTKLLESEEARLRIQFGRPHVALTWSLEPGWLTVSSYLSHGIVDQDYDCVIETALLFHESFETLNLR